MRSFLLRQIVELARQCGHLEEQLDQANRENRQLRIDNDRLAREVAQP